MQTCKISRTGFWWGLYVPSWMVRLPQCEKQLMGSRNAVLLSRPRAPCRGLPGGASVWGSQPRSLFQSWTNPLFHKQAMLQSPLTGSEDQCCHRPTSSSIPRHPPFIAKVWIHTSQCPEGCSKLSSLLVKPFLWLPSDTESTWGFLASGLGAGGVGAQPVTSRGCDDPDPSHDPQHAAQFLGR